MFWLVCCFAVLVDSSLLDIPGSQIWEGARYGFQAAEQALETWGKQGHLGNRQPVGIVEAYIYCIRHLRLVFAFPDAADSIASADGAVDRLSQAEAALLANAQHSLPWVQPLLLELVQRSDLQLRSFSTKLPFVTQTDLAQDVQPVSQRRLQSHGSEGMPMIQLQWPKAEGTWMPLVGFGTGIHRLPDTEVRELIQFAARDLGYRHFDTGQNYLNEEIVGLGLQDSGVPRHELFVATKLSNRDDYGLQETPRLVREQLQKLRVEYIDLYMFHGDIRDHEREKLAWLALEQLHKEGLIRALGLSNYGIEGIKRILSFASIPPVYLQIKYDVLRPGYQWAHNGEEDVLSWAQEHGIAVVGYSTLFWVAICVARCG